MKRYLLNPFGESDLNNKIFNSPYGILRDILNKQDIEISTIDLGDIGTSDKILSFDHSRTLIQKCKDLQIPSNKLVLFLFEPEVVKPKQYQPSVWENYGKIFTYRDDLIDNKRIFKMRYPQGQHFLPSLPKFSERKFLTLINGHKYSYIENELYSFRRQAIRYFEKLGDFDLYGFGWDSKPAWQLQTLFSAIIAFKPWAYITDVIDSFSPFTSYRGSVTDKYATLSNYKYALCSENEKNVQGWISEKLFDCFFTGTVPVYLGASNIQDYIPEECFIDMRKYKNFRELNQFLRTVTEEQFNAWQSAGQKFIRSSAFDAWRPESIFRDIANKIG